MNADARYELEDANDEFTIPVPREGKNYVVVARVVISDTMTIKFQEGDPDGGFSDVGTTVDTSDGTTGNPSASGVYAAHLGANDFLKTVVNSHTAGTARVAYSLIPQS